MRILLALALAAATLQETPAPPPSKPADLITEEMLRKHVAYLASDALEGRLAGSEGNLKATEYIAERFRAAGLRPAGDKDAAGNPTWFQSFTPQGGKKTRNCLGLLEGSDPALKDEIVVVGAHHDHLGRIGDIPLQQLGGARGDDDIFNGADDNASGTSVVLSLARAFGEGKAATRRSILFITFSAEEWGLVGSGFYVQHPIVPIEKHVFMLNMDMVGRGRKEAGIYGWGTGDGTTLQSIAASAAAAEELAAELHEDPSIGGGDSDHSSFRALGVPVLFIFTGLHKDYHRVTDHAEKLDYDVMTRIARTGRRILSDVADRPERIAFKGRRGGLPFPPAEAERRRILGVTVDPILDDEADRLGLGSTEGGLRVKKVTEGGVAAKAGIRAGDILVAVNFKIVPRADGRSVLRTAIEKIEPKQEIPVEFFRDGRRESLKIVWNE